MENVKQETRTVHDPFLGKNVEVSNNLVDRLRGKYAKGPMVNGEPEFGWRIFETPPIQKEAADRIEELVANNDLLNEDLRILMTSYEMLQKQLDEVVAGVMPTGSAEPNEPTGCLDCESWRARCAELEALLP